MPESTVAVVLAAGVGSRVGAEAPKQFVHLNGIPVLVRAVASVEWCDRILVVYHPDYRDRTYEVLESGGLASTVALVSGGSTRRQSIAAALAALSDESDQAAVVLQNAASPNTPRDLIAACIEGLSSHDVVAAYVPAAHTIFSHDERELTDILPRSRLGYSVDPTVYRLGCLRRIAAAQSDARNAGEMTLDTARALRIPVSLVRSPLTNVKITTHNDLVLLQAILAEEHRCSARA